MYTGKHLKLCKFKVIFQTSNRLNNYFRFKDFVPEILQFIFAYKFRYGNCTASYYGKTYRHVNVRLPKRQGVSSRTGK